MSTEVRIQSHPSVWSWSQLRSQASQQYSQVKKPPSSCRLTGFQHQLHWVLLHPVPRLWNIGQQISSCFMSGLVGNWVSLKQKASRPAFSSPCPGHMRYDSIRSSSGDKAGLSGSDSDWLISGSSREEAGLMWRCWCEFNQGWRRHSSAVALFLHTQTQ